MAAKDFIKIDSFVYELAIGTHVLKAVGDGGDVIKVALSATAPVATSTVLSDLTAVTAENGYTPTTVVITCTATGGTATIASVDYVEWTLTADDDANGWDTFRYAVIYNSSKSDKLIAYWDYGGNVSLTNVGEKFKVDFGASLFTIT